MRLRTTDARWLAAEGRALALLAREEVALIGRARRLSPLASAFVVCAVTFPDVPLKAGCFTTSLRCERANWLACAVTPAAIEEALADEGAFPEAAMNW